MAWPLVHFETLFLEPQRNGLYKPKQFHGSGAKIVNMGELFAYRFIGPQDMQRIQINETEHNRFSLQDGDLLFARRSLIEAGAGKCVIVGHLTEQMVFESSLIRVRLNQEKCVPRFYLYYFSAPPGRSLIEAIITGAAQKGIRGTELAKIDVHLPPLSTQRKIAAILSAYDDLIENNLRRIKILEQMAQALYREWFVKFRFPGHEQVRMVDSALGRIPEGWGVLKVVEILKKVKRGTKIQNKDYATEGSIPIVDQGKEFIGGYTNNTESLISDDLPLIVFGDHTRVLKFIDFPFACGADGTQLLKSNDERMPMTLFYYALSAIDISDFAYARHFKFLKEEALVLPTKAIADFFDQFVLPMRDQVRSLMKRNTNLRHTRDHLLPNLIAGEVNVSELDINVGVTA